MKIHTMENIYDMVCEPKITYGMVVWGLGETWKELQQFICRFCKKLMWIPSCAANAFTEMETAGEGRASKYVGQILQYWYWIMCMEIDNLAKECYEWQKSNTSVRSWTMELKEELYNSGSAFVWRKQQHYNLREIYKTVENM